MNTGSPMSSGAHRHDRPRPAGRRSARSEAVQARLLDAADALIGERQSTAITARDLARTAGVSDGVLYNHFADKHDLLLAALVRRFERLVADHVGRVTAIRDERRAGFGDELEGLALSTLELQSAALPMLANVLAEPALFQRLMTAIHRPPLGGPVFHGPIEDSVAAAATDGRTPPADPAAVADLLVGATLLLAIIQLVGGRAPDDTRDRLRAAVATIARGLAPDPATAPRGGAIA